MNAIKRGDRLRFGGEAAMQITVSRVAKDQSWADIFCYDTRSRTSWSKRQPLPLAEGFEVLA